MVDRIAAVKPEIETYKIGDRGPSGGLIFYMRGTAYEGYTYYECSKNLGEANWEEAKRMAKNHRGGGYDDWYLPNKTELNNIYENLAEKGFIEATGKFWSSSESNPSTAWCQFFINGFQDDFQLKSGHIDVRAIRVFYD